jgi:hypothetical protein
LAINFIDRVTVTDGCTEGYNEANIHKYTTVSFMGVEGSPNLRGTYHLSLFPSKLLYIIEASLPLKSGISLLALVH